ncbi:MAG: alpha-glucosidase/alpha-galactosidase, partial [Planctomycetota bacterium]
KDAAVAGDVTLLKQAMLHDPLVGAVCRPDEVWQMADEMLTAQRQWLPNYRRADLNAAAKRAESPAIKLPASPRNGAGATRRKVKSVAQLRKSGGDAMTADKGQSRPTAKSPKKKSTAKKTSK